MITFLIPRSPLSMSGLGFYDSFFNTTLPSEHVEGWVLIAFLIPRSTVAMLSGAHVHFTFPIYVLHATYQPSPAFSSSPPFQRHSPCLLYFRLTRAAFPFRNLTITPLRPRCPLQWLLYFRGFRIPRKYGSLWGDCAGRHIGVQFGSRSQELIPKFVIVTTVRITL
jgi:hypothetical protein